MNAERLRKALPYAVIVCLGIICYANSFRNEFVWDDDFHIVNNRFLRTSAYVPRFFTTDMAEAYGSPGEPVPNYRPVWMLSLLVDYQLWRLNPVGYHLTNLLLHIGVAIALFALLRQMAIRWEFALLAAALFVCHPVHTEAVTYISPRSTSMSCLFMLLSLLLLLRFAGTDISQRETRGLLMGGSLTAFALALLSKETAVTFPLAVAAACLLVRPTSALPAQTKLKTIGAFALVLAAYFGVRAVALAATAYEADSTLAERSVLALRALAAYIGLSIAPVNLHVDRLLPTTGWQAQALTVAGVATLLGLVLLCVWFYPRDRRIVFGITLFVAGFSVTSNLVPANTTFAERWLYWPMIGLLIAVATGIESLASRYPRARTTALLAGWIAVAILAALTISQNSVWRNGTTLFETAIARGADTVRVRTNLAWEYLESGRADEARRLVAEALEKNPRHVAALWAMGTLLMEQQDYAGANEHFEQAVRVDPTHTLANVGLALASEKLGEFDEAEEVLRKSASSTKVPVASLRLAHFLLRYNRLGEAEQVLRGILTEDPYHAGAHNFLGVALFRQAKFLEAERELNLALRYDRWLMDAHANLAAVAAERGDLNAALQHYDAALGLAPRNAELYYTLAILLENFGHSQDARHALHRALAIDPEMQSAKQMLEKLATAEER